MNNTTRYSIAAAAVALGLTTVYFMWPRGDALEPSAAIPTTSSPAEIVRFTATRTYTRLPPEQQMAYLLKWESLPQDVKAKTIAELAKEPYILELSSINSQQTSALHLARQYHGAPKEVQNQILDQVITAEQMMMKQQKAMMKNVEAQGGKLNMRQGDQKLRKLLIESTPPEVRVEIAAFAQAKAERMKERGIDPNKNG
jgi:hypothetical protein